MSASARAGAKVHACARGGEGVAPALEEDSVRAGVGDGEERELCHLQFSWFSVDQWCSV